MKKGLASIVILNWNGKEDTLGCLDSLYKSTYKNFEVILVDNGSNDGSKEKFRKLTYENLKLVCNEKNLGFTGGNIEGLKHSEGEYVVLLNNDIVVDEEWLEKLVEATKKDSAIGMVGGKAYRWNEDNPPFDKTNDFHTFQKIDPYLGYAHTFENNESSEYVDSISGCAVLIKREVIDKVGFLDPIFFAYYEETDLFARAIRVGYKIYYEPNAEVWHQVGKSSGGLSYFYLYQMSRNRAIFAIRNFDEIYFNYFVKDYFKKGLRSIVRNIIERGGDVETKARANAYFWVKKNWSSLIKQREDIVKSNSYNDQLAMQKEESVSIIIPNYNYSNYIEDAIKSALNQTIKPLEVIVVDDGSTDNSVEKIKKHDVKLIVQKNEGVISAKNNGFKASRGRLVVFLDADDLLEPSAIEKYLEAYRKDKSLGFVYSDMEYFGSKEEIFKAKEFNIKELRKGNYIHNSSLIKREAFDAVGGYHQSMSKGYEDWDLYLSMIEQGYIGKYVSSSLLRYRQHVKSIQSRNAIDKESSISLINTVYNRHKKIFPFWYRYPNKLYLKAYYSSLEGKNNLGFIVLRIMFKSFTFLKLIFTLKFGEVAKKTKGELGLWKALNKKKNH